jgi:UDP-arabinose 4-epimerase
VISPYTRYWVRRSVLVTGGAGYIGSHTAKALYRAGFQPVVLDNLSTGNRWAVRWGPFVEGDISDQALVHDTIRNHNITAAIHFAASAYVGESMENPRKYYTNNVVKSQLFLDAIVDAGIQELIFSSSCAVYGVPSSDVVTEASRVHPINPYGETKLSFERACAWYSLAYPLRTISLRYFNAGGADPDGELGEEHDPETHLIPLALSAALGLRGELSIFGTTFDTPDGTAVRDYVHVEDIAAAHVDALLYLGQGGRTVAINLGTGHGTSVRGVVQHIEAVSGLRVPVRECGPRPGDPARLVASAELANQLWGWTARRSDMQTIITSAWKWAQSRAGQRTLTAAQ